MGEALPDADALRQRLQQLLPAIQEAERALEERRRQHEQLLDAVGAAECVRDSLAQVLEAPVCAAQAAANRAVAQVSSLDPAAINEVRALAAPPRPVERTLQLVQAIVFSEGPAPSKGAPAAPQAWRDLQKMLRRPDFLARVKGFRAKASALVDEAFLAQLRAKYLGSAGAKAKEPLTEEAVRRASRAVALLFTWAQAQMELAALLREGEAARAAAGADGAAGAGLLDSQLSAAERGRARLAGLAAMGDLQEAMSRHSALASPVALLDAIHSAEGGPEAVAALEAQLRGAEALLGGLRESQAEKEASVSLAREHLKQAEAQGAALEAELEAVKAAAAAAGPPFCACGVEMVRRECTDLVNPNYGLWCWRCAKGAISGCGQRIWDEAPPPGKDAVPIGFRIG